MSSGCDKVCIWSNNSEKAGFEKRRNRSVSFSIVFKFRKGEYVAAKFFTVSALLATSAVMKAQEKKVDGGLAPLIDKRILNVPLLLFLQEREVFVILHSIVRLVSFVCRCA